MCLNQTVEAVGPDASEGAQHARNASTVTSA